MVFLPAVSCLLPTFYQALPKGLQNDLGSLAEFSLPFPYVALIREAVVAVSPNDQMIQYLDGHNLSCQKEIAGDGEILARGCGIARGMVVGEN